MNDMPRGRQGPDITGWRSGMVTVIEKSNKMRRGCSLWKCRCDCGKIIFTEGYKITGQKIQSCGCKRNAHQLKDLTGMRFGKLTAVRRLDEKSGSSYLWLCRCDCGNEIKASVNALMHEKNTSCGCGKVERLSEKAKDISGKVFGRLTALSPTEKRIGGSVVWKCKCSCGKEAEVSYNSLVTGNTQSCGCIQSQHPAPTEYMHYIDGTCIEMIENQKLRSDNTSGYTGVQFHKRSGKWLATITFKGRRYDLGKYKKIEEAVKARQTAEEKIFGEFLNRYYGNNLVQ